MKWLSSRRWPGFRFLLGVTLLVVQLGALSHALAHELRQDLDGPQDQVCLSCLAAQPSGSGPISTTWSAPVDIVGACRFEIPAIFVRSISVPFARQRGPPITD